MVYSPGSFPSGLQRASNVVPFGGSAPRTRGTFLTPLPAADGRNVVAMPGDVLLVLDQLLVDRLLEIGGSGAQLPQQAMTTSGSLPLSLEAHSQMPRPSVQCLMAWSMVSHCGAGCLPATTTLT